MNFEFQKLSLSHAMTASVDALVVLWPSQVQPDTQAVEPVSRLLAQAIAHGDFELKAGAVLSLYSQPGMAARHVVVRLAAEAGAFLLVVDDDGHGFPFSGRLSPAALDAERWLAEQE